MQIEQIALGGNAELADWARSRGLATAPKAALNLRVRRVVAIPHTGNSIGRSAVDAAAAIEAVSRLGRPCHCREQQRSVR